MKTIAEVEAMDEPVETAIAALAAGWASPDEIAAAVEARRSQRPLIGQLLLKHRKLTVHQVFEVLAEEATSTKLFGQIAVEKGFTTEAVIGEMVYRQHGMSLPLWQVLVLRGILTPAQAETIQASTRSRMRQPLEADMIACKI